MIRYGAVVLRWGSAFVLIYLGIFYWIDAVVRSLTHAPSPLTLPLVWLTLLLALRALWIRRPPSLALSVGAVAGMAADWHPWLLGIGLVLLLGLLLLYRYQPRKRTVLGRRMVIPWPVQLATEERFLHLHVLGPTGSGKSSSVLMPLISQDLRMGHGVLVMEPKGDLAGAAVAEAAHHGRSIIRFDPLDPECPHYNPLSGPADQAAEGLAWCLNQISAAGHPYYAITARIQLLYAVRAVKASLGETADIGHVLSFLRDPVLQKRMVRESQDPAVGQYFEEQWSRTGGNSREDRQGLLNRLELLWANPAVRRVLTAPTDFTWNEVLEEGWVVVCPLSLANLGESARALGSLLWHGLAQATYQRSPAALNSPFFLYLDEFQQWVSDDLSDFLALARGYSVGLVLAHQDMGQLSLPLQEAMMANARQRIMLPGTAADDVARFQRAAEPYAPARPLRYLRQGHAVVQLTRHGTLARPLLVRLAHRPLKGDPHTGISRIPTDRDKKILFRGNRNG